MFKWFRDIWSSMSSLEAHGSIQSTELLRLCTYVEDIRHDVFNMNARGAGHARKINCLVDSVKNIQDAVRELAEAKKEDELGPFQYEITVDDLWMLSDTKRMHVYNSGVSYFNEICPVKLAGVKGCGRVAIEQIMEWRRKCVMRITEEQIDEAISAVQRGGN